VTKLFPATWAKGQSWLCLCWKYCPKKRLETYLLREIGDPKGTGSFPCCGCLEEIAITRDELECKHPNADAKQSVLALITLVAQGPAGRKWASKFTAKRWVYCQVYQQILPRGESSKRCCESTNMWVKIRTTVNAYCAVEAVAVLRRNVKLSASSDGAKCAFESVAFPDDVLLRFSHSSNHFLDCFRFVYAYKFPDKLSHFTIFLRILLSLSS